MLEAGVADSSLLLDTFSFHPPLKSGLCCATERPAKKAIIVKSASGRTVTSQEHITALCGTRGSERIAKATCDWSLLLPDNRNVRVVERNAGGINSAVSDVKAHDSKTLSDDHIGPIRSEYSIRVKSDDLALAPTNGIGTLTGDFNLFTPKLRYSRGKADGIGPHFNRYKLAGTIRLTSHADFVAGLYGRKIMVAPILR